MFKAVANAKCPILLLDNWNKLIFFFEKILISIRKKIKKILWIKSKINKYFLTIDLSF